MNYLPIDIETTSLHFKKGKILGVGYIDSYEAPKLEYSGPLTAQNFKFEYKWFKQNGIKADIQFDTLLGASLLINRPVDLDLGSLAKYYLNWESWKSETDRLFKKKNWVELLEADPKLQTALKERNLYDLKSTAALTPVLLQLMEKEGIKKFYFDRIMPAAYLLANAEYNGMRIDVSATSSKLAEIEQDILRTKTLLEAWLGPINLNSPIQLKKVLREKGYDLWIWDFKKKAMVESTGAESLERLLPNKNIQLLIDYKEALKLKGFLVSWLEEQIDGKIYPSYNLASTRTGRLSCTKPNLQQIPRNKEIRALFISDPEKVFIIGDYSQIEPRIAAHYTKDEALLNVFKSGLDFYGSIAVNVLGVSCHPNEVKEKFPQQRAVAKEIGLSILYGIGAQKLSSIIKKKAGIILSKETCANIIKDYFKAYPRLLDFRNYVINKIDHGEILRTYHGRQYKISPDKAFSTGINTIIQGTASDECLFSQLDVEKELKKLRIEAPLVCIIHDEIIRQCAPEHAQIVGQLMEKIMTQPKFDCPLKFEWTIANSWAGKK